MPSPENQIPISKVRARPPRPSLDGQFPGRPPQERDLSPESSHETSGSEEMLGKIALGESVFADEQPFSEFYGELLEQSGHTERAIITHQSAGDYLKTSQLGAETYPETQQSSDEEEASTRPSFLPPIGLREDPVIKAFLNGEPNPIPTVHSRAGDNVTEAFLSGETRVSQEHNSSRRQSVAEVALTGLKRWVKRRFGKTERNNSPEDPFGKRPVYGNGLDQEPTDYVSPYEVK